MIRLKMMGRLLSILCLMCLASQGSAEDFTFKRVKPPDADTKKRITIQVERTWPYRDPPDQANTDEYAEAAEPAGPFDWFWKPVGTDAAGASPSRIDAALEALARSPEGRAATAPDLGTLDAVLDRYGASILFATAGQRISPALILAMIAVESAGRVDAVSPKGAQGLMQLIPETAARFGVTDPNDPLQNIKGGTTYLAELFELFKGDPVLALAGYNAGENAVIKHGGVPPFVETRAYIPKVIAAWDKARLYCTTLPRYADDGCVFVLDRSLKR